MNASLDIPQDRLAEFCRAIRRKVILDSAEVVYTA